jgi:hypothetical protein
MPGVDSMEIEEQEKAFFEGKVAAIKARYRDADDEWLGLFEYQIKMEIDWDRRCLEWIAEERERRTS